MIAAIPATRRVALVGYPTLEESDRRWIEAVRARHDAQAARIGAHFTLVFPAELPAEAVVEHASTILRGTPCIPFVLRRAEPVPDPIGGGNHVFLVPQEGRDEIVTLHDRLHEDLLRPFWRRDVPFVPHITVGSSADFEECRRLAEELSRRPLAVRGTIENIELIDVTREAIEPLMRFPLATMD